MTQITLTERLLIPAHTASQGHFPKVASPNLEIRTLVKKRGALRVSMSSGSHLLRCGGAHGLLTGQWTPARSWVDMGDWGRASGEHLTSTRVGVQDLCTPSGHGALLGFKLRALSHIPCCPLAQSIQEHLAAWLPRASLWSLL